MPKLQKNVGVRTNAYQAIFGTNYYEEAIKQWERLEDSKSRQVQSANRQANNSYTQVHKGLEKLERSAVAACDTSSTSTVATLPFEPFIHSRRLITKVGDIPFYQSTGENSKSPGTYFPFHGVTEIMWVQWRIGWFIKPAAWLSVELAECFPKDFLDRFNNVDTSSIIQRFAHPEAMAISSLLGGGFWETSIGLEIIAHLESEYPDYIKEIKHKYGSIIEAHKRIVSSAAIQEHKEYESVNQKLFGDHYPKTQMSIFLAREKKPLFSPKQLEDYRQLPSLTEPSVPAIFPPPPVDAMQDSPPNSDGHYSQSLAPVALKEIESIEHSFSDCIIEKKVTTQEISHCFFKPRREDEHTSKPYMGNDSTVSPP